MSTRYRLYRRQHGNYYLFDKVTRKRESLETADMLNASRLLHAKNEAHQLPFVNLQIARAYLTAGDPNMRTRTWQAVLTHITNTKRERTRERWVRASKDPAFKTILDLSLLETRSEHFLHVLELGGVATNVFLRSLHNFALDMNWLPVPVLPRKQWPPIRYAAKRAITIKEHEAIVARERNVEMRLFYELLWETGGSQSDIANLTAEDCDKKSRVLSYGRRKTGTMSRLHFGESMSRILMQLPQNGPLFPRMTKMLEKHRAKEFRRRCTGLGIFGVSLHSYRYSWAERARACGYPERFAQEALGHNSKAVHRAYAKNAIVVLPSLESFEKSHEQPNIVAFPAEAVRSH